MAAAMGATAAAKAATPVRQRALLSHNLNGQKLGRKGQETRERILEATRELLAEGPDTVISLSAVARQTPLGMTSLYNYFADLTELLLCVLDPVLADAETRYIAQMREPWPDDRLYDHCLALVTGFHRFWEKHARLLHLRDAMAAQGDRRMMQQRVNLSMQIIALLVRQMRHDPDDVHGPAIGMATALYAGLERVVVLSTDAQFAARIERPFEPRIAYLLEAEAHLFEYGVRQFRGGS
jgi:AcrR family transcriptional regulator